MPLLAVNFVTNLSRFILSQGKDFVPWCVQKNVPTHPPVVHGSAPVVAGIASVFGCFNAQRRAELDKQLKMKDESFSQMLLRKIQEKEMDNAESYAKAHVDRKLFSKIISNIDYKADKKTVFVFALALELPIEEVEEMLIKAGFACSDSQNFDLIIKYFIRNQFYDILSINETLLTYDQPLLGAR